MPSLCTVLAQVIAANWCDVIDDHHIFIIVVKSLFPPFSPTFSTSSFLLFYFFVLVWILFLGLGGFLSSFFISLFFPSWSCFSIWRQFLFWHVWHKRWNVSSLGHRKASGGKKNWIIALHKLGIFLLVLQVEIVFYFSSGIYMRINCN